ncbi:hypothetical protein Aduo_005869 [Ancylostoma duodenale]
MGDHSAFLLTTRARRQTRARPHAAAKQKQLRKQRIQKLRSNRLAAEIATPAHSTIVSDDATVAPGRLVPRMPASEDEISSADVFDAIVNRAPGPLDIPVMRGISLPHTTNSHNMLPSTSTTHRPIIIDVTLPFSSTAWFLSKISNLCS